MILLAAAEQAGQFNLWGTLAVILLSAALTQNILLTRFLGMCPFLAISREMKASVGLGVAVVFVTTCTGLLNGLLYQYVLVPLHLEESLSLILFIVVIAAFVQLMEMLIERVSLQLYYALGVFLPLITVNCAILGACLFLINGGYMAKPFGPLLGLMFGFGSGLGWMFAIVAMAGIREKLSLAKIPKGLQGPGIALIITGIMALAFIGFTGVIK
jgi:Na+-transporting NADH:ubiquinone oxidoreductase subunit E